MQQVNRRSASRRRLCRCMGELFHRRPGLVSVLSLTPLRVGYHRLKLKRAILCSASIRQWWREADGMRKQSRARLDDISYTHTRICID